MSIYLNTYYKKLNVGLSNYLKVLFSTYRINSIINPNQVVPCVDKEFEWIFKSIYTNDEYIYPEIVDNNLPALALDDVAYFLDDAIFTVDNRQYVFGNEFNFVMDGVRQTIKNEDDNIYKTVGYRFYVKPSDNVNTKPFSEEFDQRDQTQTIDLRYTNIPQNMIDLYLNIINKFNIQESILNHVNSLKDKINGDFLGVHIRTWKTFGDLSDNRSSNNRYKWYLHVRANLVNSINKNPNKKVLICTDNMEEINIFLPFLKDKEVYFYEKNSELSDLQNDFAELLLLSKSNYLIGSNNSTFSELAWWYANCKIGVEIY